MPCLAPGLAEERRDVAAAIADGIGSAKGGREAAETAVRGFLDGFWDVPETMEVRRAGARILDALNAWIYAQGRQDPNLVGMGCTFTALVLRGRLAHLLHVGDTRAYRLSGDRLVRLTTDHVRDDRGNSPVLTRALGIEAELRLDYTSHPVALHDRFLLCTDGVHGSLVDESHCRHPARALGTRGHQPGAGRGGAGGRQHRQLHGSGAGRGGAADGALGRCRRRHHAPAADPGAAGRRHGRWVRAERAGVRRPLQPPVRRDRRGRMAARWC